MKYSFAPLIDIHCELLILGSLPGAKSLGENQYYAHPQNKFWPIMCRVFSGELSAGYDQRCSMLLKNRVALWDVIKCAKREGSLDGDIKNEIPNDIPALLKKYPRIGMIVFNGGCAFTKYKKHFGTPSVPYLRLLSTSPACAGRDKEKRLMWQNALQDMTTPRKLS